MPAPSIRLHEPSSPGRTSPRCLHTQPWPFLNEKACCLQHSRQSRSCTESQAQVRLPHVKQRAHGEAKLIPSTKWGRADKPRGSDRLCPQTGNCFHKPHLIHVGRMQAYLIIQGAQMYSIWGYAQTSTSALLQTCDRQWIPEGRKLGRLGNNDSKHLGFYM